MGLGVWIFRGIDRAYMCWVRINGYALIGFCGDSGRCVSEVATGVYGWAFSSAVALKAVASSSKLLSLCMQTTVLCVRDGMALGIGWLARREVIRVLEKAWKSLKKRTSPCIFHTRYGSVISIARTSLYQLRFLQASVFPHPLVYQSLKNISDTSAVFEIKTSVISILASQAE